MDHFLVHYASGKFSSVSTVGGGLAAANKMKVRPKRVPGLVRCLFVLAFISLTSSPASSSDSFEIIDPASPPSAVDWQRFHQLDHPSLQKFWNYHVHKKVTFEKWHWAWKLGWLKTCKVKNSTYCQKMIDQALLDPALVVRSEAVVTLGQRYAASQNEATIAKLTRTYRNKNNYRNNKPLYIQKRILWALKKIGGDVAFETGGRLAASNRESASYWNKIAGGISRE